MSSMAKAVEAMKTTPVDHRLQFLGKNRDGQLFKNILSKGKGAKGTTIQLNHLHVSFDIWVSLVSLDHFPSSCRFIDGLEQLEGEQTRPVCAHIFFAKTA